MSKRFTDNEIRAYSKNRFEERTLRRRLDKLRDEVLIYHDTSAKRRINLIEEGKVMMRTSGGSPVPAALGELDEDFVMGQRLRRPWAYSVMETTYNNVYREAEIPLPKKRDRRRAKSAATTFMRNPSSVTFSIDKERSQRTDDSVLSRVTQSARYADELPLVNAPENSKSENDDAFFEQDKRLHNKNKVSVSSSDVGGSESSQNFSQEHVESIRIPSSNDEDECFEKLNPWIKDDHVDRRPYARVLKLPPAYTIDSKSYQDAERERLINRSRSRVQISAEGITSATNVKETTQVNHKDTQHNKPQETKSEPVTATDNTAHDQDNAEINDIDTAFSEGSRKNVLRVKENVKFKGHIIRNYIRPEDRYKLDPSVLNRHQNRMDKLAKESSSFLKRVNHENIKVEIAFPRSARSRLLGRLVQENNSGKKKTVPNDDSPIIKTKVERFMVSMSDYIERQRLERAQTFIY